MSFSQFPLTPEELKKLELQSLLLIRNSSILHKYSNRIIGQAESAYQQLNGLKIDNIKRTTQLYNFESYLDMHVEKRNCRVYFGGKSEVEFISRKRVISTVTYYVAVYDKDRKEILRKFHFDFDFGNNATHSKKPFYHLQYGGELTPFMRADGVEDQETLCAWLSLPRISFMPLSLIGLIAIIFREFQPVAAAEIFSLDDWKAHLRRYETKLLRSFYAICNRQSNSQDSLFLDSFYS